MKLSIPAAPVPEGFQEIGSWPLLSMDELTAVRGQIGGSLPSCGTTLEDIPESILLVASELATNALRHGQGPALVRLSVRGGTYLLDVVDRAPGVTPEIAAGRPTGQGGFGLRLASRLADEVGWSCTEGAKHVWATFTARIGEPSLV
ncbi:ATP-binding protein [Isoptericola jiangsuensis]|uniref:ATP-binding protein n=1 Tax=Isoptericola jiangsuensis TaxID=548579 RepID=UPI003AAA5FD7